MDIKRIRTFFLATAVGVASAIPPGAHADDTEIYTGGSTLEGVNPNVLLVLDTSGSMSSFDGEPKDRLDRMKDALYLLLDTVDNVNIGLMRFSDPGGPILFPVSAIDGDADAIDAAGTPKVNVRISDDDDDAEELRSVTSGTGTVGSVILDGLYLEFSTGVFGTDQSYTVQVDADADDAEQSNVFYNNNSTTLESVDNGGAGVRTVGMRFEDFPADTAASGALPTTVTFAQLYLTSKGSRSGDLDLTVFGLYRQDMDPFPAFASGSGCGGTHAASETYCRLGLDPAGYIAGLTPANVDSYDRAGAPGGNITNNRVLWEDVPGTVSGGVIESNDLSPVLQEIFTHPGWLGTTSDNDLGLFYTGTSASWRDIHSHNSSASQAPELRVDYIPAGAATGQQLIGLRFRNVRIPQGATITSASLELYPANETDEVTTVTITGEKVVDAPAFTTAAAHLSGRLAGNPTTATASWALTAADDWSTERPVQTPDISAVVQEVTDQSGWCGGNDVVIFISHSAGTGIRRIFSHDNDSSLAPTLRVDYDDSGLSAGEGCITEDITRIVGADTDDAEQNASTGATWLNSSIMEMVGTSTVRTNGVIFRNLPIHPGSVIESASIEFVANGTFGAGVATVTVKGELDDEVDSFAATSYNISNRITGASGTSASETFTMPPVAVVNNDRFQTADISSIVTEIVGLADWDHGDEMAFVFTGSGQVDLKTHDADPSKAATLRVRVRYNVGDVIAAGGGTAAVTTVRERLKEIISNFTHYGWTPLVDTYYEGARYYLGQQVLWGATRGNGGSTLERNTRVSHRGSYEIPPGSVYYPPGCSTDDSNLNNEACREQAILGDPNYISPIKEACGSNFMVVLTDGIANRNSSAARIASQIGSSCITTLSDGSTVTGGEACGVDLAKYLLENDLSPTIAGDNNVITYTIGFEISTQFLKDIAVAGDGKFFEAGSSAELSKVFEDIITDVLSRATSFAAPSLSVNAFNRLEDRNDVYFSLFEPNANARWNGNVKKYQICATLADACGDVGDILDAQDPPVEAVGSDGRILDTALSFWSAAPDGPAVLEGGTGNEVPAHGSRNVYTFVANGITLTGNDNFFPPESLDALSDTDSDGIIDSMTGGSAADRITRTQELMGMGGASATDITEQINWVRGEDVDDLHPGLDDRYSFSDPLHGNPLAITFGGTEDDPIIKLFAATNDGGIRLINSENGIEEWIFHPPEMMPLQNTLRANPTTGKEYGIDGTATPWIQDGGDIGVIDPDDGDFVRVYIGERRGGNRIYAMQLEPPSGGVTDKDATNEVEPKLLWRITGGTTEFARLGQTWSRPVLATMLVGTTTEGEAIRKRVMIFGGGYEDAQDGGFGPAVAVGNAIYVVDAVTGERIYVISGPGSRAEHGLIASDPGATEVDEMTFPIPSDVAAFDSDGDNAVDRLYVGDTGGKIFRVDFGPDRSTTAGILATVGLFAELSSDTADADKRKIFYPPTVVQVRGVGSFAAADYDLVGIVTGNRAHPLDTSVRDRFYGLRDYSIGGMDSTDSAPADGMSDAYNANTINPDLDGDPTGSPPVAPTTTGEVLDFTLVDDPEDLTDPTEFTTSNGYYLRLDTGGAFKGEKGLAAPTTIAGKLFFTTYLPEGVVSAGTCSLAEGNGQLYGIDAITGAAIFNWDGDPSGELTASDRVYTLGAGIPSAPVPVFLPEKIMLLVGVGGGAESVDPDITVPRQRTYWFQQEQ